MIIEFSFDNKKELKKFLNETSNILVARNQIIKRKKGKSSKYNHSILKFTIAMSLGMIALATSFILNLSRYPLSEMITDRSTLFMIMGTVLFAYCLKKIKKLNDEQMSMCGKKGTLTITGENIKMNFNGREIATTIDKVTAVIIGKYSVDVVTSNNIVFNVPPNVKEQVITSLKKYINDLLIIELK